MVKETESLPLKPQITGNFLTCPGRDSSPGSGERQLTVSDNALELDHTATRAGLEAIKVNGITFGDQRYLLNLPQRFSQPASCSCYRSWSCFVLCGVESIIFDNLKISKLYYLLPFSSFKHSISCTINQAMK